MDDRTGLLVSAGCLGKLDMALRYEPLSHPDVADPACTLATAGAYGWVGHARSGPGAANLGLGGKLRS